MTVPPGSQSAEPIKKQDNLHHLVVIALVGLLLLIVFLIIFGETGFSGQGNSNAGSAPEVFPARKCVCRNPGTSRNAGCRNYNKNGDMSDHRFVKYYRDCQE